MTVEMTPELKSLVKEIRRDYRIAALSTTEHHTEFLKNITELVKHGVPVVDARLLDQIMHTVATCTSKNISPSPGKRALELALAVGRGDKKLAQKVIKTASLYTRAQSAGDLHKSHEFPIDNQENFIRLIEETVDTHHKLASKGIDALRPLVKTAVAPKALQAMTTCVNADPNLAETGTIIAMGVLSETMLVTTEQNEVLSPEDKERHNANYEKMRTSLNLMNCASDVNPLIAQDVCDTLRNVRSHVEKNDIFTMAPYSNLHHKLNEIINHTTDTRETPLKSLMSNMKGALATLKK